MIDTLGLGKQEVDISVYAKVAAHATLQQDGVVRMNTGFTEKLGMNRTPGVTARLLEDGGLQIDISVIVRYGTDLRKVGPAVQEAVLTDIRRMADQPIGQINVYVADIEFLEGASSSTE
jgi:uncharacterized alkaline shock family protein YloU